VTAPARSAAHSSVIHAQHREQPVLWAARRRRWAARALCVLHHVILGNCESAPCDLIRDARRPMTREQHQNAVAACRMQVQQACGHCRLAAAQVWTLCQEGNASQSTNTGVFRTQRIGAALYDPTLANFRQDW
jgi:hypothetical protein